jgi:transposase
LLVWHRLFCDLGLAEELERLQKGSRLAFSLPEELFLMVANRLCDPQSKLGIMRWGIYWPQAEGLELQHLYRALDFISLRERYKRIKEHLFFRDRNLFSSGLDLLLFDTTSSYFTGRGPHGLAEYGYSRDKRPDRRQMVIAVAMEPGGIPISHHVFLGSTAVPEAFRQALSDLGAPFPLGRVVVADRGCVSWKNLDLLSQMGYAWTVGRRLRRERGLSSEVLSRKGRYAWVVDGEGGEVENLKVKKVILGGERHILCLNPEEAKRDREVRQAILSDLEEKLKKAPSSLFGNSGYRRYLKLGKKPEIDWEKVKEDERYDGKWLLSTTSSDLSAQEVALAYKGLWMVERAFRELWR